MTSSISSASVRHESPHGEISVEWARGSDGVTVDIILPPGVDAVVDIPGVPGRLPLWTSPLQDRHAAGIEQRR
ncbi:alpha-L-rhamnosidase C-terminal domain-containing protein [Microbacterium oxydans]|uniref:alpha-L-rhamnosidase C-terminal domain-containing protein n=1 Tax=Microbacterium oxydans TaxID=82380 RepID=UPI003D807949